MNASKASEPPGVHTNTFEVWQLDTPVVAYHHIFDMTLTIDQDTNLSAGFMGQFGNLPGKFGRQNLVGRDPPCIEFLYPAQLIWL